MIKDQPLHIFSVYETGTNNKQLDEASNIKRHYALMNALREQGVPFQETHGAYEGIPERGLAFHGDHHLPMIRRLADQFNQDSVLSVDREGNAKLRYRDGKEVELGRWTEISPQQAKNVTAYTFDPKTKKYWAAL